MIPLQEHEADIGDAAAVTVPTEAAHAPNPEPQIPLPPEPPLVVERRYVLRSYENLRRDLVVHFAKKYALNKVQWPRTFSEVQRHHFPVDPHDHPAMIRANQQVEQRNL
jgi:hypothetical protein